MRRSESKCVKRGSRFRSHRTLLRIHDSWVQTLLRFMDICMYKKSYVCIVCMYVYLGFKGASTSKVIGARNEMMMDDYGGQMIFGDLVGLKLPDIRLTGEEKPRKNLTQETCPDQGSNPGPLRDKRTCYHLFHSGGRLHC